MKGYFVVGSDTGVGKTHVACALARALHSGGIKVGVYKPAASGVWIPAELARQDSGGETSAVAEDAWKLWSAAGRPGRLAEVCPQTYAAPLAPYLAARQEHRTVDVDLLARGLERWKGCDCLIVEGAGGWFSPLAEDCSNADLAKIWQLPLIVTAANRIGVINQVRLVVHAIESDPSNPPIAGVVLNQLSDHGDESALLNAVELSKYSKQPIYNFAFNQQLLDLDKN